MTTRSDSLVERREGEFPVNALIGAVVMVALSWIPFATALGGVAGYLQQGTRMGGAKVGAVSGLIAAIPVFGVVGLVFGGPGLGAIAGGEALSLVAFGAIVLFALALTAVVVAGTGAGGGYVGVYPRERTDGDDYDDRGPAGDPTVEVEPETAP